MKLTENKAILLAALLGGLLLILMYIVLRPVARFENEYPMVAVSGQAVSGGVMVTLAPAGGEDDMVAAVPIQSEVATSGSVTGIPFINADGNTLESRVMTPSGYTRTSEDDKSLGTFLREYKLKPDGSPVLLYDKEEKVNQDAHVAVFKLPLEKEDLQQCADSVMRVYAEYFKARGEYSRIQFSLSDDFKASYARWREGYRIVESGDSYEWEDLAEFDGSNATFKKFMRIVFAYAGTYSLEMDSHKIDAEEMQIGDVFLHAGSPGHVVMVVDMCENGSGEKAFLLAQGYMPAQQFQLLKNPAHEDDPWYYISELSYPFETPEYTFDKKCLRRMDY